MVVCTRALENLRAQQASTDEHVLRFHAPREHESEKIERVIANEGMKIGSRAVQKRHETLEQKQKKMFSFSLIERVILSAGAMLIFSVRGVSRDSNARCGWTWNCGD